MYSIPTDLKTKMPLRNALGSDEIVISYRDKVWEQDVSKWHLAVKIVYRKSVWKDRRLCVYKITLKIIMILIQPRKWYFLFQSRGHLGVPDDRGFLNGNPWPFSLEVIKTNVSVAVMTAGPSLGNLLIRT